jgi:hypothetical protein
MKLDYSKKWKVRMCMFEYIDKMLEGLPEDMRDVSKMPVLNHLFTINENCKVLKEYKAQRFHHLVVKLLYLCRHTRQDIQTAVAFMCTRVKRPDKDDYKKLTRVMQYLHGIKQITFTIEADKCPIWWVDNSYDVHPDM